MPRFEPLSVRRGLRTPLEFQEGVPAHIRVQLLDWARDFFVRAPHRGVEETVLNAAIVALQWPVVAVDPWDRLRTVFGLAESGDDDFLDLIDLLFRLATEDQLEKLERLLDSGMSSWRVRLTEPRGLEPRLTPETSTAVRHAASPSDVAAERIGQAWAKAFGREGAAEEAWRAAVQAIEALLQPIVEPRNAKATLGTMAAALRARPDSWRFAIAARDDDYSATPFLRVLELVGYEPGRHGTDPSRATPEQARVVVLQALAIVEWLRAGALSRA